MSFRVIEDKDTGFDAFFRGVRALDGMRAKVGIQGREASQIHPGGISMVELGLIHEFSRSFLRSTADVNRRKYERMMVKGSKKLVKSPETFNAGALMFKVGETVRADVVGRIDRMEIRQELAESTKRRRGEDGPALWDEGLLVGSISSVVVP